MFNTTLSDADLIYRRAHWFSYVVARCDLVAFVAVADWLAQRPGSLERSEHCRAVALADLREAVVRGEFGRHGARAKANVAYLQNPPPTDRVGHFPIRLSAGQIAWMHSRGTDVAADLWAPRALVGQWLAARGLAPPPWLKRADKIIEIVAERVSQEQAPTAKPPSGFRTNREASAERACREWLSALTGAPSSKAAANAAAKIAVAGIGPLSAKAFERAWAAAADPSWRRPGAKKKGK